MITFLSEHWLDIFTTILGLIYIWLEYRAHIALWVVGIIMPALDIYLYWSHGLYGDAGMACYYTLAAFYGLYVFQEDQEEERVVAYYLYAAQPVSACYAVFPDFMGSYLLYSRDMDQLHRSPTRLVYQRCVVCGAMGIGT